MKLSKLLKTLSLIALMLALTNCCEHQIKPTKCDRPGLKDNTVRAHLIQREALLTAIDICNAANGYPE